MNDKNLKDMWNSIEYFMGTSEYESSSIERFIAGRSKSIAQKFRKMLQLDIGFKLVIVAMLIIDVFLYYSVQSVIAYVCAGALVLLLPLLGFEFNLVKKFDEISYSAGSTKAKLSAMLSFLRTKSFVTLLSTASTYLFGFNAGILIYFFVEYGKMRRMGNLDIFVFPAICLIGIIITLVQNNSIIKHQIKHIELCLSDLNEDILPMVSKNIEQQQKSEQKMNVLVAVVVFLAFLIFVAVLKELGF